MIEPTTNANYIKTFIYYKIIETDIMIKLYQYVYVFMHVYLDSLHLSTNKNAIIKTDSNRFTSTVQVGLYVNGLFAGL